MKFIVGHYYKIKPEIKEEWDKCKNSTMKYNLRSKYHIVLNGAMDLIFSEKPFKCLEVKNDHDYIKLEGFDRAWYWYDNLIDVYETNLKNW